MSDSTDAPAGAGSTALGSPAEYTPTDLGNLFAEARQTEIPEEREEPEKDAAPEPELAKANADPEKAPSEVAEEADPDASPTIEPPRSWTKADKEEFLTYPREAQEKILRAVTRQDAEFRRSQNEIAETRKAIQAEREIAEKVRQQYEAQLPALMQSLQDAQQNSFADIRTVADVEKMQAEDPFRFQAWQVQQMKLQAAHQEAERVNRERSQAQQTEWATHVQKENELAAEYIPELADKVKGPALTNRVATELLPELGFKDSELNDLAAGKSKLSIYDHRVQRLLADAVKLRDIQKAKIVVAKPDLPPVQRPGTSKPVGSAQSETITRLSAKLESTGESRDLGNLIAALRRA